MYAIINEQASNIFLSAGYSSGYGETVTNGVTVRPSSGDVSIRTGISQYSTHRTGVDDGASIGVAWWVDGGTLTDRGPRHIDWNNTVYGRAVSEFRVNAYLSVMGGFMEGWWFVQMWGDPSDDSARDRVRELNYQSMHVVYEPESGRIAHIDATVTDGGYEAAAETGIEARVTESARALGHRGDLAVAEVRPEEVTKAVQRVDLETLRLVDAPNL